jgi:uncharacterized repeat protein (TIGR01451 family)
MNAQSRVLPGHAVASLAFALLAAAVLVALLAMSLAYPESLAASQAAAPAAIAGQTDGPIDDSVPLASLSPNATDCYTMTNPKMPNPPGQKVKIVGEDEINIAFRWDTGGANLQTAKLDLSGTSLVSNTVKYTDAALASVGWLAMTTADLNRQDSNTSPAYQTEEVVTALRDAYNHLVVISSASNTWWYSTWGSDVNPAYIDIAAGNLDRSKDPGDEVVVAFQDANYDLRVIALDGNAAGGIGTPANEAYGVWSNSEHGRGDIEFTAIETGDFNGDGYDDEIVTVFEDSDDDLHTVGLRREDNGTMTMLWQKWWDQGDRGDVVDDSAYWTNTRTPMDVTTGDVDGDMKDEIIFAYRIGDPANGTVELMVLDPNGDTKGTASVTDDTYTLDDSVFWNHPLEDYRYMAALSVSVSAADLDGDGVDEIALGYNSLNDDTDHGDRYWQHYLVSYEYVPPASQRWAVCMNADLVPVACNCRDSSLKPVACLQQRPGKWTPGRVHMNQSDEESKEVGRANIDTGDIDGDGFAEIVYARQDYFDHDLYTYVFDAEKGTTTPSITHRYYSYGKGAGTFWLALADRDGNAKWAKYQNVCVVKDAAQVIGVIHAPPHWPHEEPYSNTWQTAAGYGIQYGEEIDLSQTSTSSIGGHMETEYDIGGKIKKDWANIGPVMSRGFELGITAGSGTSVSSLESYGFTTLNAIDAAVMKVPPEFDQIGIMETHYWCYQYWEASLGKIDVCLPFPTSKMASVPYSLKVWYSRGSTKYPDSWVPVGRDLARGRAAVQGANGIPGTNTTSTSYYAYSTADKAVDGDRNSDGINGQSVAITKQYPEPFWEVDLGARQKIDAVLLWNRTDSTPQRLASAYVFVSEQPFPSTALADTLNNAAIWRIQLPATTPERRTIVPVDRYGRYVRVQLPRSDVLQLAEVEVYGMPATPVDWPAEAPLPNKPITGSHTITMHNGLTQVVAGQVLWDDDAASPMGVRNLGGTPSRVTGRGIAHYVMAGGEFSSEKSLGLKVKGKTIQFESASSQTKEFQHGWDESLEFSAQVSGISVPDSMEAAREYDVHMYVWLQWAVSRDGTEQAFHVLDYWTTGAGLVPPPAAPPPLTGPPITPQAPLISSPTHPDEATWYAGKTVTFNWAQPAGDPAVITGYRFQLNHSPSTVPSPFDPVQDTTYTWDGLPEGVWYLHVRAASGDLWSDTAHRRIQIDATAPKVELALDPPQPSGSNGWYITPVNAVVTATDGDAGSGVAKIETSTDAATWQHYSAPLAFAADTPGTTVYARATDVAGHVSTVVWTTFQIDRTPPDSHVSGGVGPGALVATVVTGPQGNQRLILAGALQDALSGRGRMQLGVDGRDWTSAGEVGVWPGVQATWFFTATRELGAGNHIFMGSATDLAGNAETPYEIAQVVWFPTASPDISGSSISVSPTTVRPGEVVTFTIVARNGGFQDALVGISDVLPAGLSVVNETLAGDITYDAASHTLTWPPLLLWPGEWTSFSFQARADAGLAAVPLDNKATFHAFWPNTDSLSPADRQKFLDREQTVTAMATVRVNPALPAGADTTPPWVMVSRAATEQVLGGPDVTLAIQGAGDATTMYLREWTLNPGTGAWNIAQDSGWLNFSPTLNWTLSPGHGVKYVGIWVRDAAGNVSTLDESGLFLVNRWDGNQVLADGQRTHYRGNLEQSSLMYALLTTISGDPDMYAWWPDNAFLPDVYSNVSVSQGQSEEIGEQSVHASGRYLLEVQAVGASEYQLTLRRNVSEAAAASAAGTVPPKPLPQHPLAASDPLSAGVAAEPGQGKIYMPLLFRGG